MASYPFFPTGKTVAFTASTTAPSGVVAPSSNALAVELQYRIHNSGTATVFIAFGATAALAQARAVIPTGTGSNSKDSYPLVAGAVEVFSAPANSCWSGIIATGTASIYVTPGAGF
jgi:hypothetical protein